MIRPRLSRAILAPEVVQSSAMDCGPAALKCLLHGYGIDISYARLQDACHTDVDGTSIDTIEEMAGTLGLEAEQIMVPIDHVCLAPADVFPAIAVVRRENMTHFLVAWRQHRSIVQLMDPAKGRRWLPERQFRAELFVHEQHVSARAWREWAGTPEFLECLAARLAALRVRHDFAERLIAWAASDPGCGALSTLDATIRMTVDLVRARGLRRGQDAGRVIETITTRAAGGTDPFTLLPASYWTIRPAPAQADEPYVILRGAVLMRARRRREATASAGNSTHASPSSTRSDRIATAVTDRPTQPVETVLALIRRDGLWTPAILVVALLLAAGGAIVETLLLRGLLEIDTMLMLREHRLVAIGIVLGFAAAMFWLDFAVMGGLLRTGRRLEARLRAAFADKLPRLGERFFSSRLVSDVAERAHSLDALRMLPELGGRFLRVSMQLVFTAIAVAWLDPASGPLAFLGAFLALAIPLSAGRLLAERELRQRCHAAALGRHYLDSLRGLTAARTHGAERSLRRRHESLLIEWGRASLHWLRGGVVVEGLQLLVASAIAAWLVIDFAARGGRLGGTLLLVYWVLNLPMLGRELAGIIRRLPAYKNILVRVLEVLDAPEDAGAQSAEAPAPAASPGVALMFDAVDVQLGGRRVLQNIDVSIHAGEHIAIVGRSGAGKSTFAGLLLGWHTPSAGSVFVDGEPLEGVRLSALRHATAWVDPAVQLWNRSLFDNLRYGDAAGVMPNIGSVIGTAELGAVVESLPEGLQSPLGEGGALTSGGEGQRIRFGRALVPDAARLAILDEPFRGLDRPRRRRLLRRARDIWRDATLICVTHDIEETLAFDRVLVIEEGRIVEDGNPAELAVAAHSTYAALLIAERDVRSNLWSGPRWKHWRLEDGAVSEDRATRKKGSASGLASGAGVAAGPRR